MISANPMAMVAVLALAGGSVGQKQAEDQRIVGLLTTFRRRWLRRNS